MICPYCQVGFHENFSVSQILYDGVVNLDKKKVASSVYWYFGHARCPECHGGIFTLRHHEAGTLSSPTMVVYPKNVPRRVAPEVENPYKSDFIEASMVL